MDQRPTCHGHHALHLTFKCEDERYAEIHTDIPWEPTRAFPSAGALFRMRPGTVFHISQSVQNAFPEVEGTWGDLILDGHVLADDTILPLHPDLVRGLLRDLGLSAY